MAHAAVPRGAPPKLHRQASQFLHTADNRSATKTMTKTTISSSETSLILEQVHRGQQLEADAAGADEAQNQR